MNGIILEIQMINKVIADETLVGQDWEAIATDVKCYNIFVQSPGDIL